MGIRLDKPRKIVFLCGARDFHAIDWYRSALKVSNDLEISILTDLIAGEGFEKLITPDDSVEQLLILDNYLYRHQSSWGNKWRNLLKLLVMPIQIRRLKKHAKMHPHSIYWAHSMYYLFLAESAGVSYIGTPQGSDILIKPYKSTWYRKRAIKALKAASYVTVDSVKMQDKIKDLAGIDAKIIQNGIDVKAINSAKQLLVDKERKWNISIRGITPLYRIKELISARNKSMQYGNEKLTLIYPFYEKVYKEELEMMLVSEDKNLGRIDKSLFYQYFLQARIIFSIPISDSSPKSVYEGIFSGAAVAVTYHPYYDLLPQVMKDRVILVDLEDEFWFEKAMTMTAVIMNTPFIPDDASLEMFDKDESFKKILKLINN